ncbi:MAG TPA: thioredoxin domain-containing protein, partial [Rhodobacteraceae bacterium]|nr:thioredoxin domain-containing protein [Paracoccaceae bacterium]
MAQERQPNHLLGAQSPYLLQHLYNPVDWYPWGQEALNKARAENKLIFVSVGYASCHWCHVMRRESFENPEVAAILNRYFVSIKIDRELRPDLDEQFMLATRTIAGTGGWPNNLILTPLGDPFYGGTYFPPDALMSLLSEMADMWAENPGAINAEGFRIASFLRQYLTRQAAAVELTPELLARINGDLLGQMDEFEGGFGSTNKSPRESLFLSLTDVARR